MMAKHKNNIPRALPGDVNQQKSNHLYRIVIRESFQLLR
jgi:hypothetical protein